MATVENGMVVGAAAAYEQHMGWDLPPESEVEPITAEDVCGKAQEFHRLMAEAARTGHYLKADIAFLDLHDLICRFGKQCAETGEVLA